MLNKPPHRVFSTRVRKRLRYGARIVLAWPFHRYVAGVGSFEYVFGNVREDQVGDGVGIRASACDVGLRAGPTSGSGVRGSAS